MAAQRLSRVLSAWLLASRPKTLTAAWSPVFVGSALAYHAGSFRPWVALAALLGASFIQIGTNFANDYLDFEKGADDEHRLGPTRAVQAGLISASQMKRGMFVAFALATVFGAYLVTIGGWPVVAIGIASLLSGYAYTGGPYPLGYNGLGDVFVLIFFGLVAVCATYWLQTGAVDAAAVVCSLGVGAIATAILVVNNLRDADTDVKVGKRTLVVRLGKAAGRAEYGLLAATALAAPLALHLLLQFSAAVLMPLVVAPVLVALFARVCLERNNERLNGVLAATAATLFVYSAALAAGIVLGTP